MNIHDYIATGILEAYVLGELSDHERTEVEQNIAKYPELREELARVEEAQEKLLLQTAIAPKASVKANLFARVDAASPRPEAKVVPLAPAEAQTGFWKLAAAACLALAVVSAFLAYNYHNKWKASETSLTELLAQNQRVADDYNRVNQRLDKIEKDMNVVTDPAFKRVVMKGTDNAPDAMAYVYWNESSKEVYLSVQHMKDLSQDTQYQLWAIVDGKPVDAGVFDPTLGSLVKMKDIGGNAAAFAVTVEPRGGNASPSLQTMQVIGNLVKG